MPLWYFRLARPNEGPDAESAASDQFQNRERAARHRAVHIILSLPCGEQNGHNQSGDERSLTRAE